MGSCAPLGEVSRTICVAVARDDRVGDGAASHPLRGSFGDVVESDGEHGLTGHRFSKQRRLAGPAKQRQQPRCDQSFGDRARRQSAAGFFHQQRGIEQA